MSYKETLLNQIYEAYQSKLEEATSIWKSECCCISEDEDRDKEDQEELEYFKELLKEIDDNFVLKKEVKNE